MAHVVEDKRVVRWTGLCVFSGVAIAAACVHLSRPKSSSRGNSNSRRKKGQGGDRDDRQPGSDADWEDFRSNGKAVVDFVADYFQKHLRGYPVKSMVKPGYLAKTPLGLDSQRIISDHGDDFLNVLQDVQNHIVPGVTHWQHPNFFAYFPANTSPASLCGDLLSGMFNCVAFSWVASPAATELETLVLDELGKLICLPEEFMSHTKGGGVIQGSASEATLVAMLSAIQKVKEKMAAQASGGGDDDGAIMGKIVVYASSQAHSSVKKAAMIAGLPMANFRTIKASKSSGFAMDPAELESQIDDDLEAGLFPAVCVATLGTTGIAAVDPLGPVGRICKSKGVWLHVDAAWAGSALICEEHQWMIQQDEGISFVDSIAFNPHKWLLTNFDCCAMWLRDRSFTIHALSITPEYLKSKEYEQGYVSDYRDWQVPLGRRFRSLKLWSVLRTYGKVRLQAMIRNHCALAERFERGITADPAFELVAPRNGLSLVCFRRAGWTDEENHALLERINDSGRMFFVHTKLEGAEVLRFCVGSPRSTEADIDAALKLIKTAAHNKS